MEDVTLFSLSLFLHFCEIVTLLESAPLTRGADEVLTLQVIIRTLYTYVYTSHDWSGQSLDIVMFVNID